MAQWSAVGYVSAIVALVDVSVRLYQYSTTRVANSKRSTAEAERYGKFLNIAERIVRSPESNASQVPQDLRNALIASIEDARLYATDKLLLGPQEDAEAQRRRKQSMYRRLLRRDPNEAAFRDYLQHFDFNLKLLNFLESSRACSQIHELAEEASQAVKVIHELKQTRNPASILPLAATTSMTHSQVDCSNESYHITIPSTDRFLDSNPQAISKRPLPARRSDRPVCRSSFCRCRCHVKPKFDARGINFYFCKCDVSNCERRKYVAALSVGCYKLKSWWMAIAQLEFRSGSREFSICPTLQACRPVRNTAPGFVYLWELEQGIKKLSRGGEYVEDFEHLQQFEELFEHGEATITDVDPTGRGWLEKLLRYPWGYRQDAQFEILRFLLRKGAARHCSQSLLHLTATWVGQGRHLDLLAELIHSGWDPDDIANETLKKWPEPRHPGWISESITPDPFFLDLLALGTEHSPGFLNMTPLMESTLNVAIGDFEKHINGCGQADVNFLGQTILHMAIRQPAKLRLLLERGLDPTVGDRNGITPLMYAATYEEAESASILLAGYAKLQIIPTERDKRWSQNFLDYAVFRGHRNIILEAVDRYTRIDGVFQEFARNIADYAVESYLRGRSREPLITQPGCAVDLRTGFMRELILKGANVNRITLYNDSLLHLISDPEDGDMLLDCMASTAQERSPINSQEKIALINHRNSLGESPLMAAAQRGNSLMIDRYLRAGAHVNARSEFGRTALLYCARNISYRGWSFSTHHYKWSFSRSESIRLLLSWGADPYIGDECSCACTANGCTPLRHLLASYSVSYGVKVPIVPWLLEWFVLLGQHSSEEMMASAVTEFARVQQFESFDKDGLTHVCCIGVEAPRGFHLFNIETDEVRSEQSRMEQQEILEEETNLIGEFELSMREQERKKSDGNDPDWINLLACWMTAIQKSNMEAFENYEKEYARSHAGKVQAGYVVDVERDTFDYHFRLHRPASQVSLIDKYLEWAKYCVEHCLKGKDPAEIKEWYDIRKTSAERLKTLLLSGEKASKGYESDEPAGARLDYLGSYRGI